MKATSESTSVPKHHEQNFGVDLHGCELVAHAADRADQRALVAFQLLAQVADVHIERALVRRGVALVEHGGQLVARDRAPGRAHQHFQNVELDGGDLDGLVLAPDLARGGVEADVAGFDDLRRRAFGMAGAAQHGAYARQQFLGTEGLGQIIVGAGVEARDAVVLADARGQHDDRRGDALAKLAQEFKSVQHGQHHIENDQVERAFERAREAGAAVVDGFHRESRAARNNRSSTK